MVKPLVIGSMVLTIGATLLLSSTAMAAPTASGVNLTTSPIAVSLNGTPGSTVTTTLQVQNDAPVAETILVQLETFKAYGTTGAAQMLPFAKSNPSGSWVHFSKDQIIAQPDVWNPIKMTIDLPSSASLDYYYAVLFKPVTNGVLQGTGSIIKGGNAILVLVNANNGHEHPEVQVTSFASDKRLYEYLPATFSVTVKNTGNTYLPPVGDIYISRSSDFTNSIDTVPVNSYGGNVLPDTSRVFTQKWTDGFPAFVPKSVDGQDISNKQGQPEEVLRWNFANADKFRFGKYYAKLVLIYNNGDRDIPINAEISFWVIPWKILSIALVILILMMIGLYVSGHKLAARTFNLSSRAKKRKFTNHDA